MRLLDEANLANTKGAEKMPLDPQAQAVLDMMDVAGLPPYQEGTVEEARARYNASQLVGEPEPVAKIEDRHIPGPQGPLRIRIYTPQGVGPFPVLVYFHGGGWVLGNIEGSDVLCRALTNAANCIVVSVDYHLAPEYKFPVPAEDCYAATQWVASNTAAFNGDETRIAVGGDSAGGNLAAAVSQMARDRGGPNLVYQVLIYPITDYMPDTPSYRENGEGYYLTRSEMAWFWNHYLGNEAEGKNPYASPLQAKDLNGLPPAMVITTEYDPLRDEGEMYAARLKEAGIPTTLIRYPGQIHGFVRMRSAIDQSKKALDDIARQLRLAFS
jgi:acetyl esterase